MKISDYKKQILKENPELAENLKRDLIHQAEKALLLEKIKEINK